MSAILSLPSNIEIGIICIADLIHTLPKSLHLMHGETLMHMFRALRFFHKPISLVLLCAVALSKQKKHPVLFLWCPTVRARARTPLPQRASVLLLAYMAMLFGCPAGCKRLASLAHIPRNMCNKIYIV